MLLILTGCGEKEKAFPEFSAIGRINVVQDVDESTKATLRLFTTKKYSTVKVNKIDSPETFVATVSEPKMVVIRKGEQKRNSYYYTITITFSGPATFTKVELQLDDTVKTYNIGRFECKEINKTGYEVDEYLEVTFDVPFENYQEVYASDALVPIRLKNTGENDVLISSIRSLNEVTDFSVSIIGGVVRNQAIASKEESEVSKMYFGVNVDDIMQLKTIIEIVYQCNNKSYKAIAKCTLGLQEDVLESEILPTFIELDLLDAGKVCTLEEDMDQA
jgi:hypothetical protein